MLNKVCLLIGLSAYIAVSNAQVEPRNFQLYSCTVNKVQKTMWAQRSSVDQLVHSQAQVNDERLICDEKTGSSYSKECLKGKFKKDTQYGVTNLEWDLPRIYNIENLNEGDIFGTLKTPDKVEMKCIRLNKQNILDLPTDVDCHVFATCCTDCWKEFHPDPSAAPTNSSSQVSGSMDSSGSMADVVHTIE